VTYGELKENIYELVSSYFYKPYTVVWGMAGGVKPKGPLITLKMGDISSPNHPVAENVGGVPVNVYGSATTVQVDLFTRGRALPGETGYTEAAENTAVGELAGFVKFLGSEYADVWREVADVSILTGTVRDLTELINDASWDFRAMTELEVAFTQTAVGHAGVMYSGGVPYYGNGAPKYDGEGYALDEGGGRLPLPTGPDGAPVYPPVGPDGKPVYPPLPEGVPPGLANAESEWFGSVETPTYKKED